VLDSRDRKDPFLFLSSSRSDSIVLFTLLPRPLLLVVSTHVVHHVQSSARVYVRERCHDGRNLLLRGQAQRLTKELVQLAPVGTDVVIANTVRSDSANHTASGTGSNSAALSVDETVKRKYCVLRVDRRCPLRGIHTVGIPVSG
jgi:hypothetical protein